MHCKHYYKLFNFELSKNRNNEEKKCNCVKPNTCPMNKNCNDQDIIYQAKVTTASSKETYIGICDTAIKEQYRNHVCSFKNERYRNVTELSKHVWNLKDQGTKFYITVFTGV